MSYKVPVTSTFEWQQPVKDKDLTAPPGGEAKGDRYLIVGTGSAGWSGHTGDIATCTGTGPTTWEFVTKKEGMICYVQDEDRYYLYIAAWAIAIVGTDTTDTLTNKRITSRVQSVSDAATITPAGDSDDCVDITAIAQAFTIANPSGTPTNFQKLIIRIKDNGTARAITWGNGYAAGGVALPGTTVLSKILNLGFIYNTANSLNKWQLVASSQEA